MKTEGTGHCYLRWWNEITGKSAAGWSSLAASKSLKLKRLLPSRDGGITKLLGQCSMSSTQEHRVFGNPANGRPGEQPSYPKDDQGPGEEPKQNFQHTSSITTVIRAAFTERMLRASCNAKYCEYVFDLILTIYAVGKHCQLCSWMKNKTPRNSPSVFLTLILEKLRRRTWPGYTIIIHIF